MANLWLKRIAAAAVDNLSRMVYNVQVRLNLNALWKLNNFSEAFRLFHILIF